MGLVPPWSGTVTHEGERLDGQTPEHIARSGIAYVPQGRRHFPPLTVEEHLALLSEGNEGKRWGAHGCSTVPCC